MIRIQNVKMLKELCMADPETDKGCFITIDSEFSEMSVIGKQAALCALIHEMVEDYDLDLHDLMENLEEHVRKGMEDPDALR